MQFLIALIIVIEVICCLLLIGLILLQRSKNEGLGLAFGAGAGEALFGARAGNVLTKATVFLGIVFLVSTVFLGYLYARSDAIDVSAPIGGGQAVVPQMPAQTVSEPLVAPIDIDAMGSEAIPTGEAVPTAGAAEMDDLPETE